MVLIAPVRGPDPSSGSFFPPLRPPFAEFCFLLSNFFGGVSLRIGQFIGQCFEVVRLKYFAAVDHTAVRGSRSGFGLVLLFRHFFSSARRNDWSNSAFSAFITRNDS